MARQTATASSKIAPLGAAGKVAPEAANDHVPSLALALALLVLLLALLICALDLLALPLLRSLLALPHLGFCACQTAHVEALSALRGMGGLLDLLREEGKKADVKWYNSVAWKCVPRK